MDQPDHELRSYNMTVLPIQIEHIINQERQSQKDGDSIVLSRLEDSQALARLGKKQVLKRNFGFMSMLSFVSTVVGTWEAVLVLFSAGFINGGPAGLVYGYFVVWAGNLSTFATIAELSSIAPTAGGQYHWVFLLGPDSCKTFLSYMIGWSTVTAWQASLAAGGYLVSTMVQGLIILNNPGYHIERWQGLLLFWACLLAALAINILISSWLPKVEGALLLIHILGFAAILIVLAEMAPRSSISTVLSTFLNEGGWETQGLSLMVGLVGLAFGFTGTDAAVHMSEEIENPSVNVPKSIIASVILNGTMGFGILMATLLGIGDLTAALTTATGYPFLEIFAQATQSIPGSTAMASIIIVASIGGTIGFIATSSRMIWSFSRDQGLPFSNIWAKVESRTSIPVYAILLTTVIGLLLALLTIVSSAVFNDVVSLSIAGFYTTYFASAALLLWRRCTGAIKNPSSSSRRREFDGVVTNAHQLCWGPWRIPGALGIANNIFTLIYLSTVWFFSFWPSTRHVNAKNMNFSSLVYGAAMLFGMVYYVAWGRRSFKGPRIEVEGLATRVA